MISHDKKTCNLFTNWLMITLGLIFLMIIVGGLTRLTNSGLSITEWELFTGILPPLNQNTWEKYFELYKTIPQFKIMNPEMQLDEFKIIFYWEYGHRVLGRLIGLFVIIPLLYFSLIKKISFDKLKIYYFLFFLILCQGFIGWYMVESGLVNNITVSHYRLSLHLTLAIIIISLIFWQILSFKQDKLKIFFKFSLHRTPYLILIFLIFFQIVFGAFVSGLDAGKLYQTWPLMNQSYFPDDVQIISFSDLFILQDHSLVQFYHRNIAYFITVYILVLSFFIFKNKNKKFYNAIFILLSVVLIQVLLGILTLLSNLHVAIALAHQISSVILVLSALNLYYSIIK